MLKIQFLQISSFQISKVRNFKRLKSHFVLNQFFGPNLLLGRTSFSATLLLRAYCTCLETAKGDDKSQRFLLAACVLTRSDPSLRDLDLNIVVSVFVYGSLVALQHGATTDEWVQVRRKQKIS